MIRCHIVPVSATWLAAAVVGWALTRATPPTNEWLLVWAAASIALMPFAVSLVTGRFDVFEPIHLFALSFGVLFVARPIHDLAFSSRGLTWIGYSTEETYEGALALAVLGGVAFLVGYYSGLGAGFGGRLPLPPRSWSRAALRGFLVVTLLAVATLFTAFVLRSGGDLGSLFAGRSGARASALSTGSGYLYASPFALAPLGILLLVLARTWRSAQATAGFLLLLMSQVLSITGGDRSWLLPVALAVLLTWYLREGRRPRLVVLALAAAAFGTFGITVPREYRNVSDRSASFTDTVVTAVAHPGRSVTQFLDGEDTAMISALAVELQVVPERVHHTYGATYLEALARPVPRALWHGKPKAADTRLMEAIWPQLAAAGVGFSFSFFGEPYLNFGYAGVIAAAFLFGLGWKALYTWFRRDPSNPTVVALFVLNWPFLLIYMRGGFGVDYHRQAMFVLPLLAALAVARVRRARER